MTDQNADPTPGPERSASARGSSSTWNSADEPGSTSIYPDLGTAEADVSDDALVLDDTNPVPATSGQVDPDIALTSDRDDLGDESAYPGAVAPAAPSRSAGAASAVGQAADAARDVAGRAAEQAGEVKDVAVERGADVAAVAKDELAQLTGEARDHVQRLWSQASEQVRQQADTGRQQLADLLHSIAGELGEMASKSTQDGPVTALAKQAAARCGELSHRLANSEPADLVSELRRFARRRPFAFLGGAALAGIVVGRLSRSLMDSSGDVGTGAQTTGHRYTSAGTRASVPTGAGVTTAPSASLGDAPVYGSPTGDLR